MSPNTQWRFNVVVPIWSKTKSFRSVLKLDYLTGALEPNVLLNFVHDMLYGAFIKGSRMGPLLVLVSPCFRENVVVTCKIGSFCVVYIIYFRKKSCFLFWKSNIKMALI